VETDVVLFPFPLGNVRNRSNTTGDLRRLFDRLGYERVNSKTFRKTVATRLDEAGLSARQIADHLGHSNPSMTQDVYMGRRVASTAAAELLGRGTVPTE
jgi:integrase